MESYDEFCTRILSKLQSERMHHKPCSTAPAREEALSSICWHGRAVLPPVLSEKQRREMNQYRKRATQLETERQTQYNNNLLNQIQAILWTSKAQKILDAADPAAQRTSPSPKTEHKNGFRIHDTTKRPHSGDTESSVLASKQPVTQSAEFRGVIRRRDGEKKEIQEEFNADEVSLQNLLKKSREFIEKENGRQGSKVISSKAGILAESPSEKENESASSVNGTGSELPCYISCYPPPSQTSQSNLISPEPSLNARPHRGRPRPISACSIFLSYPISPTHPSITANGKPQEVKTIVTQDALTPSPERRLSGVDNAISNQCAGQSRFNPVSETVGRLETSPVDPELTSPLFRRRCHTLDSHLSSRHQSPLPDRSQERRPRFMAGITARTPTRLSPPGSMNKTFTRESPVSTRPLFMGPGLSPDCPPYTKLQFETEGNLIRRTDEMQWQVQALEEVQTSLEEDRGFRMSRLVADEEGEQLHLSQESEERGKILWAQGGVSPLAENGCEMRAAGGCYPIFSPLSTLSPGERSPRHSVPTISFPAAGLDMSSPSLQAPIYMRAINHGTGKTRHRLSQVLTADQQRALFHLTAVAKGFLTRRLLNTEKVKHLRQTVQDTQEFIRSFSTDAPKRTAPLSEQDLCLQERVRAQLRAALFDIHDIFFAMSTEERLSLLQQDRDLRTERKLRVMEKAKSPKDKVILSAATQKSLDRKKQSRMGESPGQTRRAQKPKSPPTKRILQPSQGQNSPVTGQQLLRRGSYKKTPEERVQHSERLKKQHSLG